MPRIGELIVISTVLTSGCSSMLMSDAPPDTTYWLEPAPISAVSADGSEKSSIRVAVTAAPGLDVDRILVRGPGPTLNAYSAARWPDNIPDVVETLVRTALEDSGRFTRVTSARSGARANWDLKLAVRAFYAVSPVAAAPPAIELEIRGYLECSTEILPVRLSARRGARANTLTEITAAFQSAVNEGLADLVGQLSSDCGDSGG